MDNQHFQDGYDAGLAWTQENAQAHELERLANYFNRNPVNRLRTSLVSTAAGIVLWLIDPSAPLTNCVNDLPDEFWRGFVSGTLACKSELAAA